MNSLPKTVTRQRRDCDLNPGTTAPESSTLGAKAENGVPSPQIFYFNHWLPWASAHRGEWGQLTPWKMDEKLKSENMQKKSSFLCLCYILRAIMAGRCRERRYADHIIYSDILQNAPFRSQIFKIFFASGGKGALTP